MSEKQDIQAGTIECDQLVIRGNKHVLVASAAGDGVGLWIGPKNTAHSGVPTIAIYSNEQGMAVGVYGKDSNAMALALAVRPDGEPLVQVFDKGNVRMVPAAELLAILDKVAPPIKSASVPSTVSQDTALALGQTAPKGGGA